ncbi:hypothetical protein [Erythrobacter sp. KY5]|uniref:hypothetical protein n=1 Tax=Erythrobacter sp. KY5 TaxID=2011159 RepID=UPI0018F8B096|nr:hypothetical protein [Erythrobacter sp. KY5]
MARADEAAVEASEASLDNVKQRALRSEAAWRNMANLTMKMDKEREKARLERERLQTEPQGDDQSMPGHDLAKV